MNRADRSTGGQARYGRHTSYSASLHPSPVHRWTVYTSVMVQAFVLIQTDSGRASEVARAISELDGVSSAQAVTGPYDVIVSAEAADVDALGHLVVTQIQPVTGIVRTLTCPVVRI